MIGLVRLIKLNLIFLHLLSRRPTRLVHKGNDGQHHSEETMVTQRIAHPIPYQGSKRKLARTILDFVRPQVRVFYEPFAGSAALTLAAASQNKASHFALSDSLQPLTEIWADIVDRPHDLAQSYSTLWHEQQSDPKAYYDEIRRSFNDHGGSSRLLFLLARCVKNAVRFNAAGEFNQSADHRRLGTRPDRMTKNILGAHRLLAGRCSITHADFSSQLKQATGDDLVYLDPPYQGTSGERDRRYYQLLDRDRFVDELGQLRQRSVPFIVSYDGRCGDRSYGDELPQELGLKHIELEAGRSSQSTLSGRHERTIESLYLSPELTR